MLKVAHCGATFTSEITGKYPQCMVSPRGPGHAVTHHTRVQAYFRLEITDIIVHYITYSKTFTDRALFAHTHDQMRVRDMELFADYLCTTFS